jgi:hypothetical protein
MAKTTDPITLSGSAGGLSALAARLEPQEAAAAAAALTQAMAKTTNPVTLSGLAGGLSALAARLGPQEAAAAAAALTQAMAKTTADGLLARLAGGLAAVLTGVDPPEFSRRTALVVAAVGPLAGTGQPVATPAILGQALEPLPRRFSTQELVDLLKHPTCIGPARRVILDRLEDRYRRKFADHWEFVRFAQEQKLGLDFTSPPKRPAFLTAR